MNDVQLHRIDLNLLVVFEVLMEEQSVARAADRLGRTPSAVSHALARLRETLGDPLLVKSGGKMRPSPRALDLIEELRPILRGIQRVVRRPVAFEAQTSRRVFRVAGPALEVVIAEVMDRVNSAAPDVRLEWASPSRQTYAQVIDEQIDVAWGNANAPLPDGLRERVFPQMKRHVFARRDHPGLSDWGVETWLRWPHVVVAIPGVSRDTVEERLASLGLERKVGLRVPSWSGIAPALRRTNMLANQIALLLSDEMEPGSFRVLEPPVALPPLAFRVFWSARLDGDPARAWIRDVLIRSFEAIFDRTEARLAALRRERGGGRAGRQSPS